MSEAKTLPPPQPQATPALADGEELALTWSHPPGLIGLSIKNFLLRLITLGIYGFWGRTEVRRRIWNAARLNGEPLQYTGTGGELFLGFLIVFFVVLLPVLALSFLMTLYVGQRSTLGTIAQIVFYVGFFYLTGVAIYRAQRYRLSRTRWRGIRGAMDGNSWSFAWTYFWTGVMILLTLGWASPWRSTKLQSLLTGSMHFGTRPFRFDCRSGPLYGRFAILWFGGLAIVIAIGLSWTFLLATVGLANQTAPRRPDQLGSALIATILVIIYGTAIIGYLLYSLLSGWYRAAMMNHFAAHTHFEDARFRGHATAGSLIWLNISNFLLVVLTLGLFIPIAQARSARYFVERLSLEGSARLAEISQRAQDEIGRGEGLAQAFDIDAF